jgi:hypothetical protein
MSNKVLEEVARTIFGAKANVRVFVRDAEDGSYYDDVDEKTVTFKQVEVEVRLKLVDDPSDGLYALRMTGPAELAAVTAAAECICQQLKKAIDARA